MNFSELFKLSGQLCKFSPDGKYLVSGRGVRAERGPSAGGACPPRGAGTWGAGWRRLGHPKERDPCRGREHRTRAGAPRMRPDRRAGQRPWAGDPGVCCGRGALGGGLRQTLRTGRLRSCPRQRIRRCCGQGVWAQDPGRCQPPCAGAPVCGKIKAGLPGPIGSHRRHHLVTWSHQSEYVILLAVHGRRGACVCPIALCSLHLVPNKWFKQLAFCVSMKRGVCTAGVRAVRSAGGRTVLTSLSILYTTLMFSNIPV